jgi:hypothetical protein
MRNRDCRRRGALKPIVLVLFAVVVLLGLIPAAANAGTVPSIRSDDNYTFTTGTYDWFTVTTEGFSTTPSIEFSGDELPSGLEYLYYGDGTADIDGAPDYGTAGVYHITITAGNGGGEEVTQDFTLTVDEGVPAFTSADNCTFAVNTSNWFAVTASSTLTLICSALPTGLEFLDWGHGEARIVGTPWSGTGGAYDITITASSGFSPDTTQGFTLTVNEAPAITSENHSTFAMDCSGGFTITTTGYPRPTIGYTGTLPGGLYFNANSDGTATIDGTPDPGTVAGDYLITVTASNGVDPDATQTFTVTVYDEAPTFTDNAYDATFTVGAGGGWFFAYANGYPFPQITCDPLPGGLNFTNNGNGSAQIMGTPAAGTGGLYSITITAGNRVGTDTREVALTVKEVPAITSVDNAAFAEGIPDEFTFTTTGYPTPAITSAGSLPNGVSLVDNGDGTATLDGTPAPGTSGSHSITLTAANGIDPDATQEFTLNVGEAPTITSLDNYTFTAGAAGYFSITTTGGSGIDCVGDLPGGLIFYDWGDGTAMFNGTPAAGTGGVYPITITARNGFSPDATQAFTLTVNEAPAITPVRRPPSRRLPPATRCPAFSGSSSAPRPAQVGRTSPGPPQPPTRSPRKARSAAIGTGPSSTTELVIPPAAMLPS